MMTPDEYQKLAMRTLANQHWARVRLAGAAGPKNEYLDRQTLIRDGTAHGNNLIPVQMMHALCGIIKEASELLSVMEKWLWYEKQFTLEEIQQKVKDEAGDIAWYYAELLSAIGLSMTDVMKANIAKLKVRYPDKYTAERAADEARDRKQEAYAVQYGAQPLSKSDPTEIPIGKPEECVLPVYQDGHGFGHADPGEVIDRTGANCPVGGVHTIQLIQGVAGTGGKCVKCQQTFPE